ncbi:MAG: RNA polymerase sigma factor [Fidelibacterota bacterium]
MKTEAQLINDAKRGVRDALTRLVEIHSPRIYNLALRIMRNQEDAEDVLQETFLIMMEKLDTFSGRSSLYTWLYRVATNVALGKMREKKPFDPQVSIHDAGFETLSGSQIRDWPGQLENELNSEGFNDCLRQAMEKLSENYRAVFVLRDLEGLSTRETAEVLNISEANVKVRLMRARLFLRDQLANHLNCVNRSG